MRASLLSQPGWDTSAENDELLTVATRAGSQPASLTLGRRAMKEEVARSVLKHLENAVSNLDKAHAGLGDDADLRGIGMQLQTYSAAITECRTALASSLRVARTQRHSKAAYDTNGAQVQTKPKPKKKTSQQRKPTSKIHPSPEPEPMPQPEPEPELEPEPEPPSVGRTPRKLPRKAMPMTPLFSPPLQSPIAPTREAYMQHLGSRLRTIGLDKVPSLAEMSPGLDESGTDTGVRAQLWTELWALHRENRDVESKDTGGRGTGTTELANGQLAGKRELANKAPQS